MRLTTARTTMKQQPQSSPSSSSSSMTVLFMLLVIIFMVSPSFNVKNVNTMSSLGAVEAMGRRPQFVAIQKAAFFPEESPYYYYYGSNNSNRLQFPNRAAAAGGGFFGLNNRQRKQQPSEGPLTTPPTEEASPDLETTRAMQSSSPTTTLSPLLIAQHFISSVVAPKSKEYYTIISTKFVDWWKIFVANFKIITKDTYSFLRETLPTFVKSSVTNHPISVIAGITIIVGSYVWYISSLEKQQRLEYLVWDAKEMIPQLWSEIELELEDTVLDDETDEDEMKLRKAVRKELQKRIDLQTVLQTRVNEAKSEQIVTLYAKHFPDQWKQLLKKKKITDDGAVQYMADHPALLEKLTRTLYRNKFAALLRPDYAFGMGRNGIDVTKMKIVSTKKKSTKSNTKGNKNSIDATLLESVADDLVMTCPNVSAVGRVGVDIVGSFLRASIF
jgi:hypothetical protein